MWSAIIKGLTRIFKHPQNELKCPFTNEDISQDECEENKGNPQFQPKWRIRSPPSTDKHILLSLREEDRASQVIKYSNQLYICRLQLWGKKNNFIHPPIFRLLSYGNDPAGESKDFRQRGFRIAFSNQTGDPVEKMILTSYNTWLICHKMEPRRLHLEPEKGDVCFPAPYNTPGDVSSLDLANLYLWPLLHSRSSDVIACKTFGDWKRLFNDTIHLAFPSYHSIKDYKSSYFESWEKTKCKMFEDSINPERALYLISVKSNFWPYGSESIIPKWEGSPYDLTFKNKDYKLRLAELCEMKQKYPKNAIFSVYESNTIIDHNDRNRGMIIIKHGGRNARGLCSIKKIKELGDEAKIQWLVNADFLRKMKRVHIYLESNPFPNPREVTNDDSDTENEDDDIIEND